MRDMVQKPLCNVVFDCDGTPPRFDPDAEVPMKTQGDPRAGPLLPHHIAEWT